ncbi:MAG: glycoside hydrolase family 16 protein [Bacteroidota bacterium]
MALKNIIYGFLILGSIAYVYAFADVNDTDYQLVWSDEFNYEGQPDKAKWSFDLGDGCPNICGWGNNELQYYTSRPDNAVVKDGRLVISLRNEKIGGKKYSSARLVTKGKGDWKYGRFVIRAKLPRALGTWPAIWMLPTDWKYGGWPKSGEIDIMENVGYNPEFIVGAAHTESYNGMYGTHKNDSIHIPDSNSAFHEYKLEWTPDEYSVFVDDEKYFTFRNEKKTTNEWPFDQRFHLIINIAFGGNWGGAKGVDPSGLPQQMEIDYVRVYQRGNGLTD